MRDLIDKGEGISKNGYTIIEGVFNQDEVNSLSTIIKEADTGNPAFRKTDDLFAIRQFLKEVPGAMPFIFTDKLEHIINDIFGAIA